MTFFGIELRRPSFNEITAATVMAIGLWVAAVGVAHASGHGLEAGDAGALLVVSLWGCVGARLLIILHSHVKPRPLVPHGADLRSQFHSTIEVLLAGREIVAFGQEAPVVVIEEGV